jgi:translation initiation factor 3 subunit E
MKASWGRLGGFILSMAWDDADEMIGTLRGELTGNRASGSKFPRLSDAELLQQRSWLLHWSLFVFANYPEVKGDATAAPGSGVNKGGRDKLVESFMEEANLNAIQLNCPWLLRYVTASVMTSVDKRRHMHLRNLLRVVSQEGGAAADPVRSMVFY